MMTTLPSTCLLLLLLCLPRSSVVGAGSGGGAEAASLQPQWLGGGGGRGDSGRQDNTTASHTPPHLPPQHHTHAPHTLPPPLSPTPQSSSLPPQQPPPPPQQREGKEVTNANIISVAVSDGGADGDLLSPGAAAAAALLLHHHHHPTPLPNPNALLRTPPHPEALFHTTPHHTLHSPPSPPRSNSSIHATLLKAHRNAPYHRTPRTNAPSSHTPPLPHPRENLNPRSTTTQPNNAHQHTTTPTPPPTHPSAPFILAGCPDGLAGTEDMLLPCRGPVLPQLPLSRPQQPPQQKTRLHHTRTRHQPPGPRVGWAPARAPSDGGIEEGTTYRGHSLQHPNRGIHFTSDEDLPRWDSFGGSYWVQHLRHQDRTSLEASDEELRDLKEMSAPFDGSQDEGASGVAGVKQDTSGVGVLHDADRNSEFKVVEADWRRRRASRDLGLTHYPLTESAPQLRYTPIEQTVSPGAPVSLKCSAVGSPLPVITWTRDHQPLLPSHRTSVGSFRSALGQVVSHVNLSDVTVREGGTYTCTAHNTHGAQAHSARLNVYGPPFVRAMPNVTSVAGEDVRLWCPAGGYPKPSVSWRRDGHTLPSSLRQEVLTNGTLVVRNAGHEDAGRYSCVVTGRQGQTAASHTFLYVLKPPKIEPFTFRRDLQEGERTQLTCMINSGDLPITINWLKDGRHLQHDPAIDVKQLSEYSATLLFKALQEHHSGSYTCEAANAAATANHTATLTVKVSPRWVVEPGGGTALVGTAVVMDCSARGHPQPVITWMKAPGEAAQDFQPLVTDGVRVTQAANGSLVLPQVTRRQAGWYLCRAANDVGKQLSKVVQLTVHAPARVVTEGGRVTGHSGQIVTLRCEATGDVPLTVTWLRHHAPVTQDLRTSVRESSMGGGAVRAVLRIRAVTTADSGPYTCRATNPHGDHAQTYTISVIEPPTPPSGVEVTQVGSRSARLTWVLPQPAAVTIQYKAMDEDHPWASHGRNVSVGQWAASHVLTGLTPHLTYAVRLMAHNDLGVSQPSPTQVFTTTEEAPSGAPRDVRVAAGGPRSLLVTWRAPDPHRTHGALRGYTLALRRQNLQGHLTFITRPVSAASGDVEGVEQYEVGGLVPASLYEVAVRAFTKAGPGPLSSPRIVDSTGPDAPSCPPTGVSCRGSGRGGVRVWWSPPPAHCTHAPVSGYTVVATPTRHVHHAHHAHHSSASSSWEVNTTNLEKNLDALPPATNISVRVKAFNEVGVSPPHDPVFCVTEDDVPGPPRRVRVVVTGPNTLIVTWSPPRPHTGTILHYTLYSAKDDQVAVRDVVGAGGSEATWRELRGLIPSSRIQVWVTATTVAGEGSQSPRLTALPKATPSHAPIAVGGGGRVWRVGVGSGVTLGCRGLGTPSSTVSWTKGGSPITSGSLTQLLPGGDLHLTGVRETANYTCWVRNSEGTDSFTHLVVAESAPPPPSLSLAHATHSTINLTITSRGDGGAPILGYTLHHRGQAGEWVETAVDPGGPNVVVRALACGAPHHLYLTAWNTHGTSAPSPVLVTSTLGSPPGRPHPAQVVEVNATCVTLRLYTWPEAGCPVTHWKVELGSGGRGTALPWTPLYARLPTSTVDLGLCDLPAAPWHLLRVTAASTAGETTVVYRVASRGASGGSLTAEAVQEVLVGGGGGVVGSTGGGWLDAHVVAGVVSALLLATALIICVCVAVRRRRYDGYRQGGSLDTKGGGGEDDNARNSELTRAHLYSPTPTKKPRGSLASLKTQDDTSDPYEICPYATFSVGSSEGTLEYGLSLHSVTPRDCLDHPLHSDRHPQQSPSYGQVGRQRAQSHYKETEISYISSSSSRGRAEYGSRPKSLPSASQSSTATPGVPAASQEQREWPENPKDTRQRPHRSRSRTRGETARRDSSTESNDASTSPVQQRQHYQHPKVPTQHHQHYIQQLPPSQQQQQQQPQGVGGPLGGRAGPHPLPPVRHAR